MLRNKADIRTLVFMVITVGLLVVQWNRETFHWGLFLWSCLMGVTVAVMAHNHNHVPIWKNDWLNKFQDYWITCFYGYPVFAWIATHNQNHHVLNNREGDDSITWRHTEKNTWWSLLVYPAISGSVQQNVNIRFMKKMWKRDRKKAIYFLSQIFILLAFTIGALILDWKKALLYVVIPQQCGLNSVLVFNYVQHVHADEESKTNHSRNFVSPLLNFILFNNGYHTVHHDSPLRHWSENKVEHAKVADRIAPHLNEPSMGWYFFRVYVLGTFFKRFQTRSMRLDRKAKEAAAAARAAAGEVESAVVGDLAAAVSTASGTTTASSSGATL